MEAMPFQVWHAKDPTFGLPPPLGRYHEWPDDYAKIAVVMAVNLEQVFAVTQEWWAEDDVFFLEEPRRATSVGDVVVAPDGAIYRCERFDWSLIGWVS
jgi:hypothetical protein